MRVLFYIVISLTDLLGSGINWGLSSTIYFWLTRSSHLLLVSSLINCFWTWFSFGLIVSSYSSCFFKSYLLFSSSFTLSFWRTSLWVSCISFISSECFYFNAMISFSKSLFYFSKWLIICNWRSIVCSFRIFILSFWSILPFNAFFSLVVSVVIR